MSAEPQPNSIHENQLRWRYLTTAIPYVNAAPHIGFALEMIQADCLARLYRLQGDGVRFQAGTDENSLKNVLAAEQAGLPVADLVRRNAERFEQLKPALGLSVDNFIRTSCDSRHRRGVEALWAACERSGDIYRHRYEGLYCTGCEHFYKPAELDEGLCPEHRTPPELISEENYFFRLSKYREPLRAAIESGRLEIVPTSRRNEVLAWIDSGLEDFSISRSAQRAHGWGIPVPGDDSQVIYVWFDALGNYITALGYGTGSHGLSRFWTGATSREHVIGKGITRFHALYWPAMLLSAGLELPTRILVHGYVTVDGRKIGKSAGNTVDPVPLARELGADALRYYLLRHIRSTEDGDFTRSGLVRAYTSELAGQLGNLANRTVGMIHRYRGGIVPHPPAEGESALAGVSGQQILEAVTQAIQGFRFQEAVCVLWDGVSAANRFVSETQPWSLAKAAAGNHEAARELDACLHALADALNVIGHGLAPILPSTSARLRAHLGLDETPGSFERIDAIAGNRVDDRAILFPPVEGNRSDSR